APEAESAEPVTSPPRDEATDNEPLASPEQIARIMQLAARVFPEDSEPEPEPPIAGVNTSHGSGQTSSDVRKTRHRAPVNAEICEAENLNAPAAAVPPSKVLLWVTVRRVRMAGDHGIELKLVPSSSTDTDGIRFFIEGNDPSVRTRFEPGRLLV